MNSRISKRSHQACENCRRKKTRCPGERPACSTCIRLHQICQYSRGFEMLERSLDGDRGLVGMLGRWKRRRLIREQEDRLQQLEERMELMLEGSLPNRQVGTPKSYSRGPSRLNDSESSDTPAVNAPERRLNDAGVLSGPHQLPSVNPPKEILAEGISLYFQFCHKQPLWLFDSDDSFVPENHRREVMLSMLSLSLRHSKNPFLEGRIDRLCRDYAEAARSSIMLRIAQGGVDLSTIQSLCLVSLAEYIANDTQLAWLHVGLATNLVKCAGIDLESHGGESTTALEERRRVFWSTYLLNQQYAPHNMQLNMLQDIQNPKYMAPHLDSAREMGIKPPQNPQENGAFSSRGGIWAYMVQLSSLWNEVQHFVSHCASGEQTPPWSVNSGYTVIGSHLMDMETKFPTVHRYDSARFQDHTRIDLHRDRGYWSSWLYLQFTYHAVHSVLNHPFLYSWRPQQSAQLAAPNTFWKTSSELALIHSTWTAYLIGMVAEKDYKLSDPFLGHVVAIAATIHIYYCRAADPAMRESAQRKLDTCTKFLGELAIQWPRFQEIHDKVQKLIQSAFAITPSSTRQRSPRSTLSIDTELMWQILCHKSTNASVNSPAGGLFDPSFSKPSTTKERNQATVETEIFHHSARAVDTSDGGQALPPYSSRVQDRVEAEGTESEVWAGTGSPIDEIASGGALPRDSWAWPGAGFPGDVSFMDITRDPFFQFQDHENPYRGVWKVGTL